MKLSAGKGRCSPAALVMWASVLPGFGSPLEIVLQPDHLSGMRRQVAHIHADPAAVLQHPSAQALAGGAQDHAQAALLPGAPDVGGLAALGGFGGGIG